MLSYSVFNLDARYTVQQELVLSFMSVWTACFENHVLCFRDTREEVEDACRVHAQEHVEFA